MKIQNKGQLKTKGFLFVSDSISQTQGKHSQKLDMGIECSAWNHCAIWNRFDDKFVSAAELEKCRHHQAS